MIWHGILPWLTRRCRHWEMQAGSGSNGIAGLGRGPIPNGRGAVRWRTRFLSRCRARWRCARARRRRQQHGERQHARLPPRGDAVPGISDAGGARRTAFRTPDRTLSYVQDRATFHDFEAGRRSSGPAIRSTSPSRATPSSPCRRRRPGRALHPQRRLPDQCARAAGDGRRPDRCWASPGRSRSIPQDTDHQRSRADGTVSNKHGMRGRLKLATLRQSAAACMKQGDNLFARRPARRPDGRRRQRSPGMQGAIEGSNVKPVLEMSRLIEINRAYSSLAAHDPAQRRPAQVGRRTPRRHSVLTGARRCAPSTPPPPA